MIRALAQTLYEDSGQVTNAWALYETSLRDFHTDPALDPYMKASFPICLSLGPVAHLVERLTCTEEAAGSNPVGSTKENTSLVLVFSFVEAAGARPGDDEAPRRGREHLGFCEYLEQKT